MDKMIAAVKKHALDNYNEGGWDYLVECYSDSDIREMLEEDGCKTPEEAIKAVAKIMKIKDDYRKDIEATAW